MRPLSALLLCTLAACNSGPPLRPMGETALLPLPGGPLAVHAQGEGRTVVLVHGALGDLRSWDEVTPLLGAEFRVVSYSQRGHPPDRPSAQPLSYEQHAADLVELLRTQGGGPAALVGHGYGAQVALLVALDHPELVAQLVLIEPPGNALLEEDGADHGDVLAERAQAFRQIQNALKRDHPDRAARLLFDWENGPGGDLFRAPRRISDLVDANAGQLLQLFTAAPSQPLRCGDLHRVRPPTLLVTGGRSNVYFRRVADRMVSCIPGAQRASVEGAHHALPEERPRELVAALLPFLHAAAK